MILAAATEALFQRGLHTRKRRIQGRAKTRYCDDDCNGYASGDETVLDGGRPALVLPKFLKQHAHRPESFSVSLPPCCHSTLPHPADRLTGSLQIELARVGAII
jgi:hypothetical protein